MKDVFQTIKISEQDRKLVSDFMGEDYPLEIDFNWLMPVVEKIATMKYEHDNPEEISSYPYLRTFQSYPNAMVRINRSGLHIADTLIQATWLAVVDFIKGHKKGLAVDINTIKGE